MRFLRQPSRLLSLYQSFREVVEGGDVLQDLVQRVRGAEHLHVGIHGVLQFLADRSDLLGALGGADVVQQVQRVVLRISRKFDIVSGLGVLGRIDARAAAEDEDVHQRVGAQAVGAVDRNAGDLAGGVQARDDRAVVREDLALDVRRDAAHGVVRGGGTGTGSVYGSTPR